MRELVNKEAGFNVAFDLTRDNPTEVPYWISTGSTVLDSIICKGIKAGIPGGKIASIAGLPSTGKSYIATQVAANAQKMGMSVVYFDSESAISPEFLQDCGVDLDKFLYIQARSVEFVFEQIEQILNNMDEQILFVWDSLALTPCAADWEGDYNPQSNIALKSRILSKGFTKLVMPMADAGCTFLILNQLKDNISQDRIEMMVNPYMTPGGKSPKYSYSLEIWLTRRTSKGAYIEDELGNLEGGEVKVEIKKSRFGTERRKCKFDIIWGHPPRIADRESWFDIIKNHERVERSGAWFKMDLTGDGDWTVNFRQGEWMERLEDPEWLKAAEDILEDELIHKFAKHGITEADIEDLEEELIEAESKEEE